MSVIIRKRELQYGYVSLYLDIHFNGLRTTENLKLKHKDKPTNLEERREKRDNEMMASQIAINRKMAILQNEFGIAAKAKGEMDFFEYFSQFIEAHRHIADVRVYTSVLAKLKAYCGKDRLLARELTATFFERFSKYLVANLNGDTPYGYFKKLKRVVKCAYKEKLLKENLCAEIACPKKTGTEKEVLTTEEIRQLASTPFSNNQVKNAFLLSCMTGLRYCDIKALKWKHIKAGYIELIQQKTKQRVTVSLRPDSAKLLGLQKEANDFVFRLPSGNGCNKNIKAWVRKAGISKHITWHCARHTFGTILISCGSDISTVSKLLGHTSLRFTSRYVRISEQLKIEAVKRLPDFFNQNIKHEN